MPTPRQGYTNARGEPVPGCTTVLSALTGGSVEPLLGWAAKLTREGLDFRKERERSANVGTFIHDVLEQFPSPLPARAMWMTDAEWEKTVKAYSSYVSWVGSVNPTLVAHEVQLVSEEHQAGGTFDAIFKVGDELVIADHKTGKTIDVAKISAQLAFYAAAAKEKLNLACTRGLILHYTPKGLKPVELTAVQLAHGLDLFRTARRAYSLFKTFPRS